MAAVGRNVYETEQGSVSNDSVEHGRKDVCQGKEVCQIQGKDFSLMALCRDDRGRFVDYVGMEMDKKQARNVENLFEPLQ